MAGMFLDEIYFTRSSNTNLPLPASFYSFSHSTPLVFLSQCMLLSFVRVYEAFHTCWLKIDALLDIREGNMGGLHCELSPASGRSTRTVYSWCFFSFYRLPPSFLLNSSAWLPHLHGEVKTLYFDRVNWVTRLSYQGMRRQEELCTVHFLRKADKNLGQAAPDSLCSDRKREQCHTVMTAALGHTATGQTSKSLPKVVSHPRTSLHSFPRVLTLTSF